MISYFIKLQKEAGQTGYYGMIGGDGELVVFHEPANAVRFTSEEDAETAIDNLWNQFGIDREECIIEMLSDDRTAALTLGGRFHEDGISVVEENGKRYITVHNDGFEASEELPPEVADLLVPVLLKIQGRLNTHKPNEGDR